MSNSIRLFGLILTAALCVADARAQELPLPGLGDSAGPADLSLPSFDGAEEPRTTMPDRRDESVLRQTEPVDIESFDGLDPGVSSGVAPFGGLGHDAWAHYAAPIESTGTWLRRGFWYAEAEAVVWNRHWNRDAKFLAVEDIDVLNPVFFPRTPNFVGQEPIFSTNRMLMLDGAQPGEDASVRFTLGHFLFRDSRNRDHTVQFTVFGGGDWHQHRVLSANPINSPFGLYVPFYIGGQSRIITDDDDPMTPPQVIVEGNRTFSASARQQVDYSSHFSSFEWNYLVRQRPGRDQMIMDANGNWHRAAQKGFAREYLVGLRFMELRDIFNWLAEDIEPVPGGPPFAVGDGSYLIRTDNDMFGFQMGTGLTYETSRWSLGFQTKGGVFLNDALGRTTLDFTADDFSDSDLRLANDELSFIGEFKLIARWHLLPDFSLRASYEMMYLTSQALAPNQATFITELAYLNTTQDPFYHGASFGFEGFW
jgi:hypothetical protein